MMPEWFDSEPLGWSCSMGRLANTRELILLGADPMRPANKAGNTPLKDAQRENYQDVIDFLKEYEKRANAFDSKTLIGKLETGMSYSAGGKKSTISFSRDGTFYNNAAEMEGLWQVQPENADGITQVPQLAIRYPKHDLEAFFEVEEVLRDFPYKGGMKLKCIKSTGDFLIGHEIKSCAQGTSYGLTLKSHDGKALCFHKKKDHYEGHDVFWATLGDRSEAI